MPPSIATSARSPSTDVIVIRKGSPSDYLLPARPRRRKPLLCILAPPALAFGLDQLSALLGEPSPAFMRMMHDSTNVLPLVILGIVFLGPLAEEFLFRGFMFRTQRLTSK